MRFRSVVSASWIAALAGGWLHACSPFSSTTYGSGTTDSGNDAGGGGAGGGDDGSNNADGDDAAVNDVESPDVISSQDAGHGIVEVVNMDPSSGSIFAAFSPAGAVLDGCKETAKFGPCRLLSCATPAPVFVSAGSINVGGLITGAVTPTVQADQTYAYSSPSSILFYSTANLTILATGAVVPAFRGNVPAPALASLVSPAPFDAGAYAISTASDLPITWTGGQSGTTFYFGLSVGATVTGCDFDSAAGTGSVPAAAMSQYVGQNGALTSGTFAHTTLDLPGFTVILEAIDLPANSTGTVSFE